MLKLNLPQEPYWLDLEDGVEVQVRPLTTAVMNMAHSKAVKSILDLKQRRFNGEAGVPDVDDDETRQFYIEAALAEQLALASIIDWKGVQNKEGTAPALVSPESIRGLLSIYYISQRFLQKYLGSLDALAAEGNASRLAVNGISAAGQDIVEDATTSSSPAAGMNPIPAPENAAHT
jgi:hypothetical protein